MNSSDDSRQDQLATKMLVCRNTVNNLLLKISELEKDTLLSNEEKLEQIKKIKVEISKVSVEIDKIKKEVTMITDYSIN